jgi:hypothetical protein
VYVQGPFIAPARDALRNTNNSVMLVAAGIGITPFLSVLVTAVRQNIANEHEEELLRRLFVDSTDNLESSAINEVTDFETYTTANQSGNHILPKIAPTPTEAVCMTKTTTVHLHWTIRDASELLCYIDYIQTILETHALSAKQFIKVNIYLTGLGKSMEPKYLVAQTLFLICLGQNSG